MAWSLFSSLKDSAINRFKNVPNVNWGFSTEETFTRFKQAIYDYDYEAVTKFVPEYDAMGNEIINLINYTSKKYPETALMYACTTHKGRRKYALSIGRITEDQNIPEYLIQNGADVNVVANNKTPLLIACMENDVELAKLLIENGADINKGVKPGERRIVITPLFYAIKLAESGSTKLLEYLLSTGKLDKDETEYKYLIRHSEHPFLNKVLKDNDINNIMKVNQSIYDNYGKYLDPSTIQDMYDYSRKAGGKRKKSIKKRKINKRKTRVRK